MATRGFTHRPGFQILNLTLVRTRQLLCETLRERLCSREFYSPRLKLTPMGTAMPLHLAIMMLYCIYMGTAIAY
ncbi:hypothetical protein H6G93_28295 [Nostoc sp. FACHB-973]|nr:hypothetical protein [Nostoc sp. FACHB-973]